MAEYFTNLPPKEKNEFDKTVEKLTTTNYQTDYEFSSVDYDTTIAFFVKRGFSRQAAESTAYVILAQSKIDEVSPQSLLQKLGTASEVQLSELITIILNANRFKTSRLGVRKTLTTNTLVSRNVLD